MLLALKMGIIFIFLFIFYLTVYQAVFYKFQIIKLKLKFKCLRLKIMRITFISNTCGGFYYHLVILCGGAVQLTSILSLYIVSYLIIQ